jgi:hypothetical protein
MSQSLALNSADPKDEPGGKPSRQVTVAKRPLANWPVEKRQQVALEVLGAYQEGQEIADLAPEYGVSDVTLYALLIRDHEDAWKDAQKSRAVSKRDRTTRDLEELRLKLRSATQETEEGKKTPHDALSLARIREQVRVAEIQAKRAEWELERVYRRLYGQDDGGAGVASVRITLNVGGGNDAQHKVIDAE